ncbi:hypothetical protein Tco_1452675 [Tanacetum coccineum]
MPSRAPTNNAQSTTHQHQSPPSSPTTTTHHRHPPPPPTTTTYHLPSPPTSSGDCIWRAAGDVFVSAVEVFGGGGWDAVVVYWRGVVAGELYELLLTIVAALVGCFFVFIRKRSSSDTSDDPYGGTPKKLIVPKRQLSMLNPDKKKVTIIYGTQTCTSEGLAKVN